MARFDEDHHIILALNDLVTRIVARRQHRRSSALIDAARADWNGLHRVILSCASSSSRALSPPASAFLCFGGQWRNLAIWWVRDEGRSHISVEDGLAFVQAELREVVVH